MSPILPVVTLGCLLYMYFELFETVTNVIELSKPVSFAIKLKKII